MSTPLLKRCIVSLNEHQVVSERAFESQPRAISPSFKQIIPENLDHTDSKPELEERTVLVINASTDIAKRITSELSVALPGCSILFSPTLATSLLILKKHKINLIISSPILPDGALSKLHNELDSIKPRPELLILSKEEGHVTTFQHYEGYKLIELRRLSMLTKRTGFFANLSNSISLLGADLRNDLNNPLQQIVAFAFVAQTSEELSPIAKQALTAIEHAASSMANVVNKLEDKIRVVVENS